MTADTSTPVLADGNMSSPDSTWGSVSSARLIFNKPLTQTHLLTLGPLFISSTFNTRMSSHSFLTTLILWTPGGRQNENSTLNPFKNY